MKAEIENAGKTWEITSEHAGGQTQGEISRGMRMEAVGRRVSTRAGEKARAAFPSGDVKSRTADGKTQVVTNSGRGMKMTRGLSTGT